MTYRKRITGVLRAEADGFLRMDCGKDIPNGAHVILDGGGFEARYKVIGITNKAHILRYDPRTCMEALAARHEPQARAAR